MSQPLMLKKLKLPVLWRLTRPSRTNTPNDVLFIIGDWNAKVGSQEIPGITGKFGLGVQNEAGQRLIEFCQENALVIANTLCQQHKRNSTHGHHKWSILKSDWWYFFAAEDVKALYSQHKQDRELTVAQIMSSLSQSVSHSVVSDSLRPHGLSMEFFRQEYWSGLPFPPPGDLPYPGFKLTSPKAPALQADFFFFFSLLSHLGSSYCKTQA